MILVQLPNVQTLFPTRVITWITLKYLSIWLFLNQNLSITTLITNRNSISLEIFLSASWVTRTTLSPCLKTASPGPGVVIRKDGVRFHDVFICLFRFWDPPLKKIQEPTLNKRHLQFTLRKAIGFLQTRRGLTFRKPCRVRWWTHWS